MKDRRVEIGLAFLMFLIAAIALIPQFGIWLLPQGVRNEDTDFQDSFNDIQFDGAYNTTLWRYQGTSHVEIQQRNGVMAVQTTQIKEDGNNALFPLNPERWRFEDFKFLEAKLKLDRADRGEGSHVKIQIVTVLGDGLIWWAECQISNAVRAYGEYFCNTYEGSSGVVPPYEYQTAEVRVDYDAFYTARMEKDPNTDEFRFFLDGRLIGSHRPSGSDKLHGLYLGPQIGLWAGPDENVTGYFDDVRIG